MQRIQGALLQQLSSEAQETLTVLSVALIQMPLEDAELEDAEDEATAVNKQGDAGQLLIEAWFL